MKTLENVKNVGKTSKNVARTSENVEEHFTALREQVISFVKGYYEEHGVAPPIRVILKSCETYTGELYKAFPGKLQEICEAAGVPVPEKRMSQVEKATAARREIAAPDHGKLPIEIQADEEEEALTVAQRKQAAEERARKARNELIEIEAKHDPKKIIPYLRTLETEITAPFFEVCEKAGITPRKALKEAVKLLGQSWEEWGRIIKADGEEPYFKAYVSDVIGGYVPWKRLKLALEHHKKSWYKCVCSECGLPFECEDEKGRTSFSCPDGHRLHHGGLTSVYHCPVCKELERRSLLAYDRTRNMLHCKVCSFEGEVRGDPLNPKGTKAGVFKNQIAELAEKVKSLNVRLNETQRQVNAGGRRVQVLERKREKEEVSLAKIRAERKNEDRELDVVRDEKAKELRLRDSLKRENNHEKRKREMYNSMAEFLMDSKLITGEQLADVVKTLSAALEMRSQQGHVGEVIKMTVETRGRLLKRIAKGRFILKDKAEKRLGREIAEQRREYDMKLKAKDTTIDAERRNRKAAEVLRREYTKKIEEQRTESDGKITELEDEVQRLEGELETLFEEKEALEEGLSSGPRSQPQLTSRLKLIKRGVS